MEYLYRTNILFYLLASAVALVLAIRVWPLRNRPLGKAFISLLFILFGWFLVFFLESLSVVPLVKITLLKVSYLFSAGLAIAWVYFIFLFIEKEKWLNRYTIPLFVVIPVITNLLVWTNESHHLIWKELIIRYDFIPLYIHERFGLWHWINIAYAAFLVAAGVILIVQYLHTKGLYENKNKMLVLCCLIVLLGHALYVIRIKSFEFLDPLPLAFVLSSILIYVAITKYRLFNMMPIAYETLFKNMNDGIIVTNPYGIVIDVNPVIERINFVKRFKVVDRHLLSAFPWLDFSPVKEYYNAEKNIPFNKNGTAIMAGEVNLGRLYEVVISPVIEDRYIGDLIILHDITERKRLEQETIDKTRLQVEIETLQKMNDVLEEKVEERTRNLEVALQAAEQANKAKTEFLASVTHELKTPLTGIIGLSQILQEEYFGQLNEKQKEYVNDINQSGMHLLALINDLLDLSVIEAGRLHLNKSNVNISNLISNSVKYLQAQFDAKKIRVSLSLEETERLEMVMDERRVTQVMLNLLTNAIKFTQEGGLVEIETERNGDSVKVSVADNGLGIEPEEQTRIFEAFYQVNRGLRDKTPGVGLGLAICKAIIEAHNGKIWVESEGRGKGSRFVFVLPIRSSSAV